jgi:hypothetical protein
MDKDKIDNWAIVGLAVFAFLVCVVQSLSTEPLVAWVCLVGAILAIDIGIGIVQIHIREVA